MRKYLYIILLLLPVIANAQFSLSGGLDDLNYSNPKEYEIGGITVSGAEFFNATAVKRLAGITVGDKIQVPGDKLTKAIKNLWAQKIFSNVQITATKVQGDKIFLDIYIQELPRLSKFKFKGVKKSKQKDLREELALIRGKVVNESLMISTKSKVQKYFIDKGYYNVAVDVVQKSDSTLQNYVILIIDVNIGDRIKIKDINFYGNTALKSSTLRGRLKDTKVARSYNIFSVSKYIESSFNNDKEGIIAKYNEKGYRDAKIESDSVYRVSKNRLNIDITVSEGNQYYFRNIKWVGNTIHSTEDLNKILNIHKGDVYDKTVLDSRLFMNQNGRDVSSLYLDKGYLFFQVSAVEVNIENDSIDYEMRIYEGKQARVNNVTIVGNSKTRDHVIRREIRTSPGQLFSRADIIRTQRELAQLGYFNPETLGVNPKPNQEDGTVDIEYVVEEKPSDQIELSGGWGGGRILGTLGVTFSNFSARNFFNGSAWRPLPSGDGQRLSIRAQSSGAGYQNYSISFTEPWLGGRKPNSLTISAFHSLQSNGATRDVAQSLKIYGLSVGLGQRLKFPDDFFTLYNEISYQYYVLNNFFSTFAFSDGVANNISFKTVLSRNSVDSPIYPKSGSSTTLTLKLTPPYSAFRPADTDYSAWSDQELNRYVEYHKWKFQTQWYTRLTRGKRSFVLNTKAGFGYLGAYNSEIGTSTFERFYMGGDGLSGFSLDGREIIKFRGYGTGDLSPRTGAAIVAKYTAEIRYPFSLNPSATIYGLVFGEAGNSWSKFSQVNPYQVNKAAGVGIRVFMPMFGMLGLDWGYRFDDIPGRTDPNNKTEIHFTIGGNINGW